MGKSVNQLQMAIFNSYLSLPDGKYPRLWSQICANMCQAIVPGGGLRLYQREGFDD